MSDRTLHPSHEELEGFYQGRLGAPESRNIVRHLLGGCDSCKEASTRLWAENLGSRTSLDSRPRADYAAAFDRAADRAVMTAAALEHERRAAPALLEELGRHPPERQELLVRNSATYQTYGLCEFVLRRAFEEGFREPSVAVRWARLGVQLSELVEAGQYGDLIVVDLRGHAWAILGNAHRNASQLTEARKALTFASELLEQGTGDPSEKARLHRFESMLEATERRYPEALTANQRALAIHRRLGDLHLVGRDLSQEAFIRAQLQDEETAIGLWEEALEKLEAGREPRMIQVVRHSLAVSYINTGRLSEADRELTRLRPEYVANGHTVDLLRCDWAMGQLRAAQGRAWEAEEFFTHVRDGFVELEIPVDAALVSLDLAQALFDQGKVGKMRQCLSEAIPILRGLGIHREAIAALTFLKKTADMDQVTEVVIRATARFVEEVRDNPDLVFKAPALASQA